MPDASADRVLELHDAGYGTGLVLVPRPCSSLLIWASCAVELRTKRSHHSTVSERPYPVIRLSRKQTSRQSPVLTYRNVQGSTQTRQSRITDKASQAL